MNKEEFITSMNNIKGVTVNNTDKIQLIIENDVDNIEFVLKNINEYEQENDTIDLNIKNLSIENLSKLFKYVFENPETKNPVIVLNVINLIKTYNTLDDNFFSNEKICISSIEEFLDLKLTLREEIKNFIRKYTIYFLSILRSHGKVSFLPSDKIVEIPSLFDIIFMSLDLVSLCSIFSKCESLDISECGYVRDNFRYMESFLIKNTLFLNLMNLFNKDEK